MTITMLLGLFGGLGMFIYGMHLMSEGLKIVAGSRMRKFLDQMTSTRFRALLCGILITIMVQSSSATTVMVVGFVNASLMSLTQAAGIILGSNIGTTIMAQIIAFDITAYSTLFIGIGTFLALFSKKKQMKDWGSIVLGFGILFFGIAIMSDSMMPIKDSPEFIELLLNYAKNPVVALILSAVMTGILQSSGAVIGLVQALAIAGIFSGVSGTDAIRICIPLIIGSNIGTCVTALLSSIGTSNAAKDAAYIHLFINIFGAVWVLFLLYLINITTIHNPIYEFIVDISGTTMLDGAVVPNVARQIAMAHMLFNVVNTIVLYPFLGLIVKLIEKILPPEKHEEVLHLDTRLLNTPVIAINQAKAELVKMSRITAKNFGRAMDALIDMDEDKIQKVIDVEDTIDNFEKGLQEFTISITNLNTSANQSDEVAFIQENSHTIERIGDHAYTLADLAKEMIDEDQSFTDGMVKTLKQIKTEIGEMLDQVTIILGNPADTRDTIKIFKEEDFIDHITTDLREKRIDNVDRKKTDVFPTFIFIDVLSNVERVSDLAEDVANAAITFEELQRINTTQQVIY